MFRMQQHQPVTLQPGKPRPKKGDTQLADTPTLYTVTSIISSPQTKKKMANLSDDTDLKENTSKVAEIRR